MSDSLLQFFYFLQLAIWIYTALNHIWDPKRNDYYVMYAHHIVTIGLVSVSAFFGYYRIGLVVLAVHDSSDIFLDVLKLANYLKLEGMQFLFITEISFVSMTITWVAFRMYYYPFYVLHSSSILSWELMSGKWRASGLVSWLIYGVCLQNTSMVSSLAGGRVTCCSSLSN